MEISKLKLVWRFITGGTSGVVEYLFEVANNAVNSLPGATKEKIRKVLEAIDGVLAFAVKYSWLCPERWRADYDVTVDALKSVSKAAEDLELTQEELGKVVDTWKIAYATWMAD